MHNFYYYNLQWWLKQKMIEHIQNLMKTEDKES